MAVAAFVLSLVWLGGLGSILAVIFGFTARSEIKKSNGAKSGDGLAIAAIIIGFVGICGIALLIVAVAALGTAANTIAQALRPQTVAYGTTVNISGGVGSAGLKTMTVYSLTTPAPSTVSGASGGNSVVVTHLQVCADSSGSQSGFDSFLMSVYFSDGQKTGISSATVSGAGRNLSFIDSLAADQCISGYLPFEVANGTHPVGVEYAGDFFRTIHWTN
jgi:hypothetical protein